MKLFLALTLGCTSLLVSQTSLLATPDPLSSYPGNLISLDTKTLETPPPPPPPPPPPDEPPPGGRVRGGAKRGSCPADTVKLTALVPFTQPAPSETNVWGLTTAQHPTLWFYVPISQNSAHPSEFVLQDQDSNPIYQQDITLPNQPGVIGITLPTNAPSLALNQRYRWFFTIYCDREKQLPPMYVEGVIKRVNLNQAAAEQLRTAQPLQQFAIYAKNGIWHEALTTLATLRQKDPQNAALQSQWQDFLTRAGFGEEAKQPIISRE
ncbi:DUF928 domain-containing protein [Calothrix sp. PCC 7507]|uniref:DUF928 domain-containing protein n=1 Tax=Calothrix sp. PCC 7507 TaxID=99598 RepID=UPI00029F1D10|nr:DUF928 domain-containing protein [Calothrix sp. PCC 7507]AFY34973.1 protein of unknown function DUF928 [Calothrix sp. PCC 7507]